jgi:hypothetical protein
MQTLIKFVYPPGYQSHLDREVFRSRACEVWDLMQLAEWLVAKEEIYGGPDRGDQESWSEVIQGIAATLGCDSSPGVAP